MRLFDKALGRFRHQYRESYTELRHLRRTRSSQKHLRIPVYKRVLRWRIVTEDYSWKYVR